MATISKGITLTWAEGNYTKSNDTWVSTGADPVLLTNLLEIPEIGSSDAGYEQIDITTLADSKMKYMNGLESASESEALEFKFLYEKEQFALLENGAASVHGVWNAAGTEMSAHQWTVTLPDGSTCKFLGKHSVRLEGVGVNSAITYILTVTPDIQYGEFKWDFTNAVAE